MRRSNTKNTSGGRRQEAEQPKGIWVGRRHRRLDSLTPRANLEPLNACLFALTDQLNSTQHSAPSGIPGKCLRSSAIIAV